MLNLSQAAIIEKNRPDTLNAWLILLEITINPQLTLRLVRNTDNIIWAGQVWTAFPFELDAPEQNSNGELPVFNIRVSNITHTVEGYLEQAGGGIGAQVRLMVVMSNHLDLTTPELDEVFSVQSTSYDENWVTFSLTGAVNLFRRIPSRRFFKNFCPYKFKGIECQYTGTYTTCDKSLKQCRQRGNVSRFGGEPAIPQGGLYAER